MKAISILITILLMTSVAGAHENQTKVHDTPTKVIMTNNPMRWDFWPNLRRAIFFLVLFSLVLVQFNHFICLSLEKGRWDVGFSFFRAPLTGNIFFADVANVIVVPMLTAGDRGSARRFDLRRSWGIFHGDYLRAGKGRDRLCYANALEEKGERSGASLLSHILAPSSVFLAAQKA